MFCGSNASCSRAKFKFKFTGLWACDVVEPQGHSSRVLGKSLECPVSREEEKTGISSSAMYVFFLLAHLVTNHLMFNAQGRA